MKTIMVTGGAGFIGHNFIKYWTDTYPSSFVINYDRLPFNDFLQIRGNLASVINSNYISGDIRDLDLVVNILKAYNVDCIVNFAAESHNSYAITNPTEFFSTNVIGTQTLLEAARRAKTPRFHHISTCEVFGDLALDSPDFFVEDSPYNPNTPYNASKAGADMAVKSYYRTFGVQATISNCCNNYGPYQHPEKMIPLFIAKALRDEPLTLYSHSENRREWIHVMDHCRAIELVIRKGRIGETYNIGTGHEASVEEVADQILDALKKPKDQKVYVQDRPSHDRRYLLSSQKIEKELGWKPSTIFFRGLRDTIKWYSANVDWWDPLLRGLKVDESKWHVVK